MPTGYTADVQSGKVTELRDYAMRCARAFGALGHMRDLPHDAPIPTVLVADTSYEDGRLAEDDAESSAIEAMTSADTDKAANDAYGAAVASWRRTEDEAALHRERYESMLAKVEAWRAPEQIGGLRSFMLSQLRDSISYDDPCVHPRPKCMTGQAWRTKRLEDLAWNVARNTRMRQGKIDATVEANLWLDALRTSIL